MHLALKRSYQVVYYALLGVLSLCRSGTGLYKSEFLTYSFGKTIGFHLYLFWFFMFLLLWFLVFVFSALCFEFNIISKDLMPFFNFALTLFKRYVKYKNRITKSDVRTIAPQENCPPPVGIRV